jgi:hypothetical protein
MKPTILTPTLSPNFASVGLGNPVSKSGSQYFMKLYNNNESYYVQIPRITTKQGVHRQTADLMFSGNDPLFVNFIEKLEEHCQQLLFDRTEELFQTPLTKEEIETCFISSFKLYRSGKFYSMRVSVKPTVHIYDLDEVSLAPHESLTANHSLVGILEVSGVIFSANSFRLEYELKQANVVPNDPFSGIIQPRKAVSVNKAEATEAIVKAQTEAIKAQIESIKQTHPFDDEDTIAVTDTVNEELTDVHGEEANVNGEDVHAYAGVNGPMAPEEDPLGAEELPDMDQLGVYGQDGMFNGQEGMFNSKDNAVGEPISLSKPNDIHRRIYMEALAKANEYQQLATKSFADAERIKQLYQLV